MRRRKRGKRMGSRKWIGGVRERGGGRGIFGGGGGGDVVI